MIKIALKFLKWISVVSFGALLLWFFLSFFIYRATVGDSREYSGAVHYKFLDLGFSNRQLFEEVLGNRIVRIEGHPPFFVSVDDHAKLWPENPHEMHKKGYTIGATLGAKPLVLGGLAKANVLSTEVLNEQPSISK